MYQYKMTEKQIFSIKKVMKGFYTMKSNHQRFLNNGAGDGTRTRDHLLGRQMLYQLSYSRLTGGGGRIRTCAGIRQEIYSLPPLARLGDSSVFSLKAGGGTRTHGLVITNHLLCRLSYASLTTEAKIIYKLSFFVNNLYRFNTW